MRTALRVAGAIFLVVAVLHVLRVIFLVRVLVGSHWIPLRVSAVGAVLTLVLAVWMFMAANDTRPVR